MLRIRIDPTDARPIWSQLVDQLRVLIASGPLEGGAAVPSVRELAKELLVNPATVAKAYRSLTNAGLLVVRRGQGTFVAEDPPMLGEWERSQELARAAGRYSVTARSLRVPLEQAEEQLQASWREFDGDPGERASRRQEGVDDSEPAETGKQRTKTGSQGG